jgi:hypothetical protein
MLEVGVKDEDVVIRGLAPCYYLKQLAIQAVLDVIGPDVESRVKVEIEVPGSSGTFCKP